MERLLKGNKLFKHKRFLVEHLDEISGFTGYAIGTGIIESGARLTMHHQAPYSPPSASQSVATKLLDSLNPGWGEYPMSPGPLWFVNCSLSHAGKEIKLL